MPKVKIFLHSRHIELWDWLVDHPDKEKWQWPGWKDVPAQENDCFACGYSEFKNSCADCPLVWPDEDCYFDDEYLFARWDRAEDLEEKAKLAAQIRDLPVREGVVCDDI
jgi:hypothetical protein